MVGICLSFLGAIAWPLPDWRLPDSGPRWGFRADYTFDEERFEKLSTAAEKLTKAGDLKRALAAEHQLAGMCLSFGRNAEAVTHFESAARLAEEIDSPKLRELRFFLGVAILRQGEVEQCLEHHSGERCLFPIQGGGVWSSPQMALRAAEVFRQLLEEDPYDEKMRWLLNLAWMASGEPMEQIPERWRLPAALLEVDPAIPVFEDVASSAGIERFNLAGSVAMDDFDGDGWLDLVTGSLAPNDTLRFHRNEGGGVFSDQSAKVGLDQIRGGLNLAQTDFNNDGRLDLFVMRGAWWGKERGRQHNALLQQLPDGSFEDVTEKMGMAESNFPTQAGAWGDFDGDGFLDLFVGNEDFAPELFRNEGGERFVNVAAELGLARPDSEREPFTKGAAWGDYDNDGDPDLFVANWGPDQLFRNDGASGFTEVSEEAGLGSASNGHNASFAVWFFDY
ncbi:MAG: FG-GAP-like repeat-containing protein, partial [Verrucomicrobiota bacterium]